MVVGQINKCVMNVIDVICLHYYIQHGFNELSFSAGDIYLYANDSRCSDWDWDYTSYSAGYLDSVEQCYQACKFVSTMFSFGKNSTRWQDPDGCNSAGCLCVCETSSKWGRCPVTLDGGSNLYSDRSK